jgi:hypothetical protein
MLPNRLTRLGPVVKRKGGKLREVIVKISGHGLLSAHEGKTRQTVLIGGQWSLLWTR